MNKPNFLITLFSIFLLFPVNSQRVFSNVKKISNGKGTFWGYWGYHRTNYTKSDIAFKGTGYDFILKNASASDNQSKRFKDFVRFNSLTVPQFNVRVGYYFKNKYALSFGYDHMKYIFDNANNVLLSGTIDPGVDSVWSGSYSDQAVVTNANNFHYQNANGMNYIHFQLTRTENFYQSKNMNFALSANLGVGLGCILSVNNFNFENKYSRNTSSLSGFGISVHGSLRFEFFKNFFIQPELSGGSIYQIHINTRKDDKTAFAKQHFWYAQRLISAGVLMYLKPINSCDDCPVW